MAEYQKKNFNSLWYSPLVLSILFLLILLFIYNMIGIIGKVRDTNKKTEIVHSQIENLKKRENALSNDISRLKTDEGVEAALRDKYQLVKSGEKMVVIVDQEASVAQAVPEKTKGSSLLNFLRTFLNSLRVWYSGSMRPSQG
jgi:cell division protein FtsB